MDDLTKIYERLNQIEINQGVQGNKIDNLHAKFNYISEELADKLKKHDETIYGNGHPGLTSKIKDIQKISEDLNKHSNNDLWGFGIMITLLISILGWSVFHIH